MQFATPKKYEQNTSSFQIFKLPFSTNRHQQMACNTRPKIQLKDFRPGGDLKEKKPPTGRKFLNNPHGFCWIHFFGTTKGVYIFCLPTLRMDPWDDFLCLPTMNGWLVYGKCKWIYTGPPFVNFHHGWKADERTEVTTKIGLKSWHLWRLQTWDFRSFQPLVGPGI